MGGTSAKETCSTPGVLEAAASKYNILLSNPPFEEFTGRARGILHDGRAPTHPGKAAELLHRALPHLLAKGHSSDSCCRKRFFNGLSPWRPNSATCCSAIFNFRKCACSTTNSSGTLTTKRLVLGRKVRSSRPHRDQVQLPESSRTGHEGISTKLSHDEQVQRYPSGRCRGSRKSRLWIPDFADVWKWTQVLRKLSDVATFHHGMVYKGQKSFPENSFTYCGMAGVRAEGREDIRGFCEDGPPGTDRHGSRAVQDELDPLTSSDVGTAVRYAASRRSFSLTFG